MAAQVLRSLKLVAVRRLPNLSLMINVRSCCHHTSLLMKGVAVPSTTRWNSLISVRKCIHSTSVVSGSVVPFNLSDIGEGIKEVTVKEWSSIGLLGVRIQSDKASVTITSRYDGQIKKLYYDLDDTALVGQPLVDIELFDDGSSSSSSSSDSEGEMRSSQELSAENAMPGMFNVKTLATPAVRREDILSHIDKLKRPKAVTPPISIPVPPSAPLSVMSKTAPPSAEDRIEPIKGVMRAMVRTMTKAKEIPHFVYSDEINLNQLVELRTQLKDVTLKRGGVKLSYMPFFVKAASMSLIQFPIINSSVDEDCTHVIYKVAHNIGVAMDTPLGLVVPVVKNVQKLTVFEIAAEINRLQRLGLKGNLKQEDVGGTYTKPVILPPEVAIVALGRMQLVPRFDQHMNVVATHILYTSWAADHRIVDGATMARFSNVWKDYVENPSHLLLDMM
ncbi:hypothetical protein B566_EDAN000994 [Ephemera danica]|nr:hypothetical protein B566_EDAN000994 [Ephemera danica]